MAFKFVVLTTLLACANAGLYGAPAVATYSAAPAVSSSYIHQASPIGVAHAGPVVSTYAASPVATYASSPVAIHAPAYGQSHQSVERSLGGAQSVSHYSKAVDSAFSSVRKYDTRITNDALSVAHAPVVSAYSSPVVSAYSAPSVSYAAPSVSYAAPAVSYSAPAYNSYIQKTAYAAPVATYATHSAPLTTYAAHAAPITTYAAHAAPVTTYAAHAAPLATYSAHASSAALLSKSPGLLLFLTLPSTVLELPTNAIFGNKKYLRFDEDHEKLLTCLELSDIEGCDNEDDDSKNENGNADGIREENVEEQSEINAENFNKGDIEEDLEIQSDFESDESDPEMKIPLSTLKDQWGWKSWKKT
ncbi:hypothetical protein JTB14_016606 [Gonioctena quinquepunctata]|nr:hypothetical protein JTB14_016606 [Gonioctena quinquepunctata]